MATEKVEVEMLVDTFNLDMGGRLRAGNVYEMEEQYADHLKARRFAKVPTKKGREVTEQTKDEEIKELMERLQRLTGDGNFSNSLTADTLQHPPSPEPSPVTDTTPVVMTSSTRRRTGIPDLEQESPPDITDGAPVKEEGTKK